MAAGGAGGSIDITREEIQTAADTLGVLSTMHEHKFGRTPLNHHLQGGLKALEIAGYTTTFISDPKQGLSDAISGTMIGAMDANPILLGMNVAGSVSQAILPVLRSTAAALRERPDYNEETDEEYRQVIATFEVFAAYHRGIEKFATTLAEGITGAAVDFSKIVKERVEYGAPQLPPSKKSKEAFIDQTEKLGKELGQALQDDPRIKPLLSEYAMSMPPVGRVSSGPSGAIKPPNVKVGVNVFGSTSAGFGAILSVSMPLGPASFAIGALAVAGMIVANLLLNKKNKKKTKKKKEEFKKISETIHEEIQALANKANEILESPQTDSTKISALNGVLEGLKSLKGSIRGRLEKPFGHKKRKISDPASQQYENIADTVCKEIENTILPVLRARVEAGARPFEAAARAGAGESNRSQEAVENNASQ